MFYEFDQNNSGGHFTVNDKVCHRLFIEAESEREAIFKAEELGCYWDGVNNGIDCPCCGDRWSVSWGIESNYPRECNADTWGSKEKWYKEWGSYEIIEEPKFERKSIFDDDVFQGKIKFNNVEEYAQYLANRYGSTTPDARIYYADGTVKEIFTDEIFTIFEFMDPYQDREEFEIHIEEIEIED